MKGFVVGLLLGGFLVFILLAYMGILMSNNQGLDDLTGNAVNTPQSQLNQQSNQAVEQLIVDDKKLIKENMVYYQTIEVYVFSKISVNVTSDEPVNYALLPDFETDHYTRGESFTSFANKEGILFIQESYNLDAGKYSIVITTGEKPSSIHLVIKSTVL